MTRVKLKMIEPNGPLHQVLSEQNLVLAAFGALGGDLEEVGRLLADAVERQGVVGRGVVAEDHDRASAFAHQFVHDLDQRWAKHLVDGKVGQRGAHASLRR